MTEEFIRRCGLDESIAVAGTYEKLDIIEGCMTALHESVRDGRIISIARSYTQSTYFELLDNVKNALAKLVSRVLSVLNNYYMNNVKLLQKYRNLVVEQLRKPHSPIYHDSFVYPDSKDYPRSVRSSAYLTREIENLHKQILSGDRIMSSQDVSNRVNRMLEMFGKQVLDTTIRTYDLKGSVSKAVELRVRGNSVSYEITEETVDRLIKEISDYHRERDDILRLQRTMTEDYEFLKSTYKSVTSHPEQLARNTPRYLHDPDREEFIARETSRYADIHVEMMRLFNGFLTIYQTAFETKLRLLDAKYNDSRNTLNVLFTNTNVLATINVKPNTGTEKPIPFMPGTNSLIT